MLCSHLTNSHKDHADLMGVIRRHLVQDLHSAVYHLTQRIRTVKDTLNNTAADFMSAVAVSIPEFWAAAEACLLRFQRKVSGTAGETQSCEEVKENTFL